MVYDNGDAAKPRDPDLEQRAGGPAAIATGDEPAPPLVRALWRHDRGAPGDRCPHGGTAIRSGVDRDGDGVLDDREVERTAYTCPQVPVVAPLRLRPEPAGRSFPTGGTAVDTGMDDDASGTFDAGEVGASRTFCGEDELIDDDVVKGRCSGLRAKGPANSLLMLLRPISVIASVVRRRVGGRRPRQRGVALWVALRGRT